MATDSGKRTGLIGIAINQPVFTTMVMLGLVVLGIFSFRQLSIDQFPDVSIPVISIQTIYPGASPNVIETEVTQPIEEVVNPVRGVDTITSSSLEGVSLITVEFDLGIDIDAATADVRSKIEQIRRDLPEDMDPPVVQQFDPAEMPIISLALSSDTSTIGTLTGLSDDVVRPVLEGVNGVGRVQITGGVEREIHVLLQPDAMQALGITAPQIQMALQQQNLEIPAGRITENNREQLVRVFGRIERPEQFGNIIVGGTSSSPVRLSQIAVIEDTTEEARSIALINGRRAVGIDILKVVGANTVDVADGVIEAVGELEEILPQDVAIEIVRDNSEDIRESVRSTEHELILGAFLTVVIVLLFLGDFRATTITSLTLPVSVISTFILLSALGFTLNILTLMALSLSIGILVDDAIVVIENIVRKKEEGLKGDEAAYQGTKEIFLAVMATTLSIVAVFVPVAFMGGIIGKFFFEFGLTIAWAVLVSLLVSFTLTPMLAAKWRGIEGHAHAKPAEKSPNIFRRFRVTFDLLFDRFAAFYGRTIRWALRHRKTVVLGAIVSFVAAIALFPFVGGAFAPEEDTGTFRVNFETPAGSSYDYTVSKAHEIESSLRTLPGVVTTYTTVGAGLTGTVTQGTVAVDLTPRGERDETQQDLMAHARDLLRPIHNVEASVLVGGGMGGAVKPIQIVLRGPDIDTLQEIATMVQERVTTVPGAIEVDSSLGDPRPEVVLNVDIDKANDLGLDAATIAGTVRPLLAGQTATTWEDPGGEERDVVVRLPEQARQRPEQIAALPIATTRAGDDGPSTVSVMLGQVGTIVSTSGPAQIDRRNLARVATVDANLAPGTNLTDVSSAAQEALASLELPAGYSIQFGGETEDLQETMGYVVESLFLAIVLIYLILASQFGSFTQPVTIMMSLPLSLVGVILALLITDDTLNIMSMIGIILLMGLVTKNAILLIDNANQQRREGTEMFEAVAKAGVIRLRPILMTTFAMIFGMLPVAIGMGDGGEFRAPMARAVIGGLTTSTVLTLVVVPVIYTYLEGLSSRFRRKAPVQTAEPTV